MADDLPTRQMRLKVVYTFDTTTCLARASSIHTVHVLPSTSATQLGALDLRSCLTAVASASPELVADTHHDYAVYTVDFSENDAPLVGHGLLSWALSAASEVMVCGRVCSNALAMFGGAVKDTLEVKVKLTAVEGASQTRFMRSMQLYSRLSKLIPGSFDASTWSAFVTANPKVMQLLTSPAYATPLDAVDPTHSLTGNLVRDPEFEAFFGLPGAPEVTAAKKRPRNVSKKRNPLDTLGQASLNKPRATSRKPRQPTQSKSALQAPPAPTPTGQEQVKPAQRTGLLRATATPSTPSSTGSNSPYIDTPLASSPPVFNRLSPLLTGPIPKTWTFERESESIESGDGFDALMSEALDEYLPTLSNDFVRQFYQFQDENTNDDMTSPELADITTDTVKAAIMTDITIPDTDAVKAPTPLDIDNSDVQTDTDVATTTDIIEIEQEQGPDKKKKRKPSDRIHSSLMQDLACGKVPRYCENCGNIKTSTWRKIKTLNAENKPCEMSLCNPCGLYYSARKLMRPQSLWSDEIPSEIGEIETTETERGEAEREREREEETTTADKSKKCKVAEVA